MIGNLLPLRPSFSFLIVSSSMTDLFTIETFVAALPAFLVRVLMVTSWTSREGLTSGLSTKLPRLLDLLVLLTVG